MRDASIALLPDRGVVSVTGEDARKLLSGILTNDMNLLDNQPALFAGLLSPQGKILFEFFVIRRDGGYLLDVARDQVEALVKRLTMYRLRAKAVIEDLSAANCMLVSFGIAFENSEHKIARSFVDPRCAELGARVDQPASFDEMTASYQALAKGLVPAAYYHAHRIALGIPEGGKDYDFGDAFPHEANFDLNHGVSFEKGCYVGQEIVARMQHRGTVRKRIVRVAAMSDLPFTRPDVLMGEVVIGRLGSVAGRNGLAMLRLDRAIEAIDQGIAITAAGVSLEIDTEMIGAHRALMAARGATP